MADELGSSFAAEKTTNMHLTNRKRNRELNHMNGKVIKPSNTAKRLGIIFKKEI
jgi:hypothetical protein